MKWWMELALIAAIFLVLIVALAAYLIKGSLKGLKTGK